MTHLLLIHGGLVAHLLAVDLVRTDVHEPLDAMHLCRLQEHMCAQDVVLGELKGVAERVIHVGLRGEVHDGVDLLLRQHVIYQVRTADVSLDELVIRVVLDLVQVRQTRAVCNTITYRSNVIVVTLYIQGLQSKRSKLTMLHSGYFLTSNRTTCEALQSNWDERYSNTSVQVHRQRT
jgi:hypothetical protein